MERTSQRYISLILFAAVLALVSARVVWYVVDKNRQAKGDGGVQWVSLDDVQRIAATTRKPILYDFTADWCAPCHELDEQVFSDPEIAAEINERFIPVRVVDRQREDGRNPPAVDALERRYAARGFPTVVFAEADGTELARMEGFRGREEFRKVMERVR